MFQRKVGQSRTQINAAKMIHASDLIRYLKIAYELKAALEAGDTLKVTQMKQYTTILILLVEYMLANIDNPSIDKTLLQFLVKFLGMELEKHREEEEELEEEYELSQEEKERVNRLLIYEFYKVTNPNRLAGETAEENFLNNVITRGIKEAIKYSGQDIAEMFDPEALKDLESHRHSFVDALAQQGIKSHGITH